MRWATTSSTWTRWTRAASTPTATCSRSSSTARAFGVRVHPFTGVDYVDYYRNIIEEEGAEAQILFSNRPEAIVGHAASVLCCDIHTRERTRRHILAAGRKRP